MKATKWILFACAVAGVVLAGCGSSGSTDNSSASNNAGSSTTGGEPAKPAKTITVGFSQIGAESDWRKANTESIKEEAAKRGIDLKFSDGQQKQENQIKALRSFVAQGVDVIILAPVVETGWGPVMKEIKDAGIPVIVSDRRPDVPDDMYVTFIGSDFIEEGKHAGEEMEKITGGKAVIAELTGTPGSAPANDREKGFADYIKDKPDMKVVWKQTGNFTRTEGKQAMEALLKSPQGKQITALYAHNDDMALGAIQAIEEAGLKPGKDIKIVSIDGVKAIFQAMVDGKANVTVECNPLLGPQLFDAVQDIMDKKDVPKRIVSKESVYEQDQAAAELPNRKY